MRTTILPTIRMVDWEPNPIPPIPPGTSAAASPAAAPSDLVRGRICILDFDAEASDSLRKLLEGTGHEVLVVNEMIGASNRIRAFSPDVLVVDTAMPSISGSKLISVLRHNLSEMPLLIIFSNLGTQELMQMAQETGADECLPKSGSFLPVINRINVLILRRRKEAHRV